MSNALDKGYRTVSQGIQRLSESICDIPQKEFRIETPRILCSFVLARLVRL